MSALFLLGVLVLSRIVHRRLLAEFGAGTVQHLVRLPGNLLHELAHAVAFWVTGHTVRGFNVSLFDPAGRGGVTPGPPWTRFTRPWVANFVSPVAPILAGTLVLNVLGRWTDVPGLPTTLGTVVPVLQLFPVARWETWVGLLLAYSVTVEIAPSDLDVAAWWRPALVVAGLLALVVWALSVYAPGVVGVGAARLDAGLRAPMARALGMTIWSGLLVAPVALVVGRLRR